MDRFDPCGTDECKKRCDSYGVACDDIMADEIDRLRAELAEYQRCVEQVQGQADRAYCNYIERLRREECLGWENKLKRGLFGDAELKAHCAAAEQLGRHRALSEVAAATRLLSQAADALERAPRWRDVADELMKELEESK